MCTNSVAAVGPRRSLLDLPIELRLQIYERAFRQVIIDVDQEHARRFDAKQTTGRFPQPKEDFEYLWCARPLSLRLALANRQVNNDLQALDWHGLVTYSFPNTVAMLDVLLDWPLDKLTRLRYVRVIATPVLMYKLHDPTDVRTFHFVEVLPLLRGLQLDLLIAENAWLDENGKEQGEVWGTFATMVTMHEALETRGWRRFEYVSGPLVDDTFDGEENRWKWKFVSGQAKYENIQNSMIFMDRAIHELGGDGGEAVDLRYGQRIRYLHPPRNGKHVRLRSIKAPGAEYVQTGQSSDLTLFESTREMSWREMRESGEWLVQDGTANYWDPIP